MDKKTHTADGAGKPLVKLSQCMIVKNEEKNIERALGWARDIAFEQIVVDTGSTDRTVMLAQQLGAKVYHFEWIDDFAAAKNYAIEQATGNWIAFLDADEYFLPEDAAELIRILNKIEKSHDGRSIKTITCSLANLDNDNNPVTICKHKRVFRNIPQIRYARRIHEDLTAAYPDYDASGLCIMHTGYTFDVLEEKGKIERNIKIIRQEIERNPDDISNLIYLADTLKLSKREEDLDEMERLCVKAIESSAKVDYNIKQTAYYLLLPRYFYDDNRQDRAYELCRAAVSEYPDNIDFLYYLSVLENKKENHTQALKYLSKCDKLITGVKIIESNIANRYKTVLYQELALTAQRLGDTKSVIKYLTLVLREDRRREGILEIFIYELKRDGKDDGDILVLLKSIYDFDSARDKVFITRAAKNAGAVSLAQTVMAMITPEEVRGG